MGNTLDEGMLIQRIDLHREAKLSDGCGARLMILIEHMDGTNYTVSVVHKETPEHMAVLLANVARGADMMIRALDILRAIGYVDTRPVALLGRQIIFGLDRVTLELEIIEHSDGNVEEIGGVLEEKGIDVI